MVHNRYHYLCDDSIHRIDSFYRKKYKKAIKSNEKNYKRNM